jgi:hypothetical protein
MIKKQRLEESMEDRNSGLRRVWKLSRGRLYSLKRLGRLGNWAMKTEGDKEIKR